MNKLLLTTAEVCQELSISRGRVYEMIYQKEIPSVRVGRSIRVPRKALEAWIRERQIGGPVVDLNDLADSISTNAATLVSTPCQVSLCEAIKKIAEVISKNN